MSWVFISILFSSLIGMLYAPEAHPPKSICLQRSEQNGLYIESLAHTTD